MPFFNVTGITCTGSIFNTCLGAVPDETQASYGLLLFKFASFAHELGVQRPDFQRAALEIGSPAQQQRITQTLTGRKDRVTDHDVS